VIDASPYGSSDLVDGVLSINLLATQKPSSTELTISADAYGFEKLIQLLKLVESDESVRVIVLLENGVQFEEAFPVTTTATATTLQETSSKLAQCLRHMPQPIVAMVHGQAQAKVQDDMKAIWDACDIVFADGDWATLSFPDSELEEQTYKLARELATKDPLALRFTKKTVQQVASVAWDDILNFTTAQQAEIKSLQAGGPSARALAIESFLAGKSKPGAGA
jgi:enoyl-CoA hydratase/carnithine racemase